MKGLKFKVADDNRRENGRLQKLTPLKKSSPDSTEVDIENWQDWEKSLWIKFREGNNIIVVDSGVIEQLAEIIKGLKKAAGGRGR